MARPKGKSKPSLDYVVVQGPNDGDVYATRELAKEGVMFAMGWDKAFLRCLGTDEFGMSEYMAYPSKQAAEDEQGGSYYPIIKQVPRPNPASLPPGFEGFGADVSAAPPQDSPRANLIRQLGVNPATLSADRFVKPAGMKLLDSPAIDYFWAKGRGPLGWLVNVNAASEDDARRLGRRVQDNLVSRKHLTSADPSLHHVPLFVAYKGGYVELPGLPKHEKDTTLADAKDTILRKGREVFGASGVSLGGSSGDYSLSIRPVLKEHRGKFSEGTLRAPTLPELSAKLDAAIAKVQQDMPRSKPKSAKPAQRLPYNWANWEQREKRTGFIRWAEPAPEASSESRYAIVRDNSLIKWLEESPNPDAVPRRSGGAFYGDTLEEAVQAAIAGVVAEKARRKALLAKAWERYPLPKPASKPRSTPKPGGPTPIVLKVNVKDLRMMIFGDRPWVHLDVVAARAGKRGGIAWGVGMGQLTYAAQLVSPSPISEVPSDGSPVHVASGKLDAKQAREVLGDLHKGVVDLSFEDGKAAVLVKKEEKKPMSKPKSKKPTKIDPGAYRKDYEALITEAAEEAHKAMMRDPARRYLYMIRSTPTTWGALFALRDGDAIPAGAELVQPEPLRTDKTREQLRRSIYDLAGGLPLLPAADPIPARAAAMPIIRPASKPKSPRKSPKGQRIDMGDVVIETTLHDPFGKPRAAPKPASKPKSGGTVPLVQVSLPPYVLRNELQKLPRYNVEARVAPIEHLLLRQKQYTDPSAWDVMVAVHGRNPPEAIPTGWHPIDAQGMVDGIQKAIDDKSIHGSETWLSFHPDGTTSWEIRKAKPKSRPKSAPKPAPKPKSARKSPVRFSGPKVRPMPGFELTPPSVRRCLTARQIRPVLGWAISESDELRDPGLTDRIAERLADMAHRGVTFDWKDLDEVVSEESRITPTPDVKWDDIPDDKTIFIPGEAGMVRFLCAEYREGTRWADDASVAERIRWILGHLGADPGPEGYPGKWSTLMSALEEAKTNELDELDEDTVKEAIRSTFSDEDRNNDFVPDLQVLFELLVDAEVLLPGITDIWLTKQLRDGAYGVKYRYPQHVARTPQGIAEYYTDLLQGWRDGRGRLMWLKDRYVAANGSEEYLGVRAEYARNIEHYVKRYTEEAEIARQRASARKSKPKSAPKPASKPASARKASRPRSSAGSLKARIAKALGWTLAQVDSTSLPALRDLVRPVNPKLAELITQEMQSGAVVVGKPKSRPKAARKPRAPKPAPKPSSKRPVAPIKSKTPSLKAVAAYADEHGVSLDSLDTFHGAKIIIASMRALGYVGDNPYFSPDGNTTVDFLPAAPGTAEPLVTFRRRASRTAAYQDVPNYTRIPIVRVAHKLLADAAPYRAAKAKPLSPRKSPPRPSVPALFIDAPNAVVALWSIGLESNDWLVRQHADEKTLDDPNGFYTNLAAFKILKEMGTAAKGLIVSDIVPSAGMIAGEEGRAYVLMPDGQIALMGETASPEKRAAAAKIMMVA